MLAKKYRLTEREIRKVFQRKKPFFSYMLIANVIKNSNSHGRFAILLSGKVTGSWVNRNAFRREFYDTACEMLPYGYDVVVIPKKWVKLNYKNKEDRENFKKNLQFLFKKITQ